MPIHRYLYGAIAVLASSFAAAGAAQWHTETVALRSASAVIRLAGGPRVTLSPYNAQLSYTVAGRSAHAVVADADPSMAFNSIKLIDARGSDYPLLEITASSCGRACLDDQWFYSFESAGPSLRLLQAVTPAEVKPLGRCPQVLHSSVYNDLTYSVTTETRYIAGELPDGKFALVIDKRDIAFGATSGPTCRPN